MTHSEFGFGYQLKKSTIFYRNLFPKEQQDWVTEQVEIRPRKDKLKKFNINKFNNTESQNPPSAPRKVFHVSIQITQWQTATGNQVWVGPQYCVHCVAMETFKQLQPLH